MAEISPENPMHGRLQRKGQGSRITTNQHSQQVPPMRRAKQHSRLRELSRCRKQTPCTVTTSRDLNPISPANCHVAEAKTSFLPCKEEDKLLHRCKMSKSSHNMCKHYRMSLSFSFCRIRPRSTSQARGHAPVTP